MLKFQLCSVRVLLSFFGSVETEPLAWMYVVRVRRPGTEKRCVAGRNANGVSFTACCALRFILRLILRFLVRARSCSTVRTARRARRILGLLRNEAVHWFAPGMGAGFFCLWFRTLPLGVGICLGINLKMSPGLVRGPGLPLPLKAGGGKLRNFQGHVAVGCCPHDSPAVRGERVSLGGPLTRSVHPREATLKLFACPRGAGGALPTLSSSCLTGSSNLERIPGALGRWRR